MKNLKRNKFSNTIIILVSLIGLFVAFMLFNDTYTSSQYEGLAMFGMVLFALSIITAILNLQKKYLTIQYLNFNNKLLIVNGILSFIYSITTLRYFFKGGNMALLKLILLPLILAICFAISCIFRLQIKKQNILNDSLN